MFSPGSCFGEPAREGRGVTVPLDTVNDIRSMDAAGRSRSEIARMLHVSRNTVAKYADMKDMSPAAPMPQRRGRPALEGNEEWWGRPRGRPQRPEEAAPHRQADLRQARTPSCRGSSASSGSPRLLMCN